MMAKSEGTVSSFDNNISIAYLLSVINDLRAPKGVKQAALNRIRSIERQTGKTLFGCYNKG